jgi:hypothetical protein
VSIAELGNRPGGAAETARNAPVIIMAYAGSGADQLRTALSVFPELTCTQGTGILPLCHQAVTAWQTVDDRGGEDISPLAAASVRALCGGLMTAVLAREGGSRWCEFTSATPAAAHTFACLYPSVRFLIMYRRADAMTRAIISSGRWGLEGREFVPFVLAHPASPVAALASYWVAHTAQQLEYERANPGACHRVRVEDLTGNTARALPDIIDFLALDGARVSPSFTRDDESGRQPGTGDPAAVPGLPLGRIPAPLLAQVNDLHRSLGYLPVTAAGGMADDEPQKSRT